MNSDKYFSKYTMISLEIKDKKFRCNLLEMPYFIHRSEMSDLGIKRHMTIRSDNRFALKIKESFDPSILELEDTLTLSQIDSSGFLVRKWTLSTPRFDSYIPEREIYLIDCTYWVDEVFDPNPGFSTKMEATKTSQG